MVVEATKTGKPLTECDILLESATGIETPPRKGKSFPKNVSGVNLLGPNDQQDKTE